MGILKFGSNMNNSVVAITGGTGSFGSTMAKYLLTTKVSEVRVFSRDENKQDTMRNEIQDARLKFYLGDTRDRSSVDNVIKGSDFIFHAAALKQVPSTEFFPMQAVATNIQGSNNVFESSVNYKVKSVVALSTDKAVYPINAMGISKAMMEKVVFASARNNQTDSTKLSVTRYGNVMMSRGSVIPLFIKQIKSGVPLTVTDPRMTRFLMSLEESVELVLHAFENGESGDLFVRKAPACTVQTLIDALIIILSPKVRPTVKTIGIRHGEKKYEALLASEEKIRSNDQGKFFRVPLDTRSLDYQIYFDKGQASEITDQSFTSNNTNQLTVDEVAKLILELPEFKSSNL
jgi:UDP-N-acetylglucosamine 4,6-dehydratase/5-epimerase